MARLQRSYYVYIMASKSRVIYVGVTGSLMAKRPATQGWRRRRVYAEISRSSTGLFSNLPQHRGRHRTRDRDQEVAAREESGSD